jgi:hypothetical protein
MKDSKHISKTCGFKIPKSYFEGFKIEDFTNHKRKVKSGFDLPDNYFENFNVKPPKTVKVLRLSDFQKTVAVAAVLIVILGTLLVGLILDPLPDAGKLNFSKINKTEIENYLEDEMLMDHDLYIENKELELDFENNDLKENKIIDDMDDISIEQLMDY